MTETEAQMSGDETAGDPVRSRRPSRFILPVLLLLCLAAIAFLSVTLAEKTSEQRQRDLVESSARIFVRELTTYSHKRIDKDIQEVVELSTGSFKRDYQRAQGGEAFQEALIQAEGSSDGKLVAVAIKSISDDEAEVLTVLDQTVTNNKQTEPRTERRYLEILMVKTPSGWKTDRVSVL